MHLLIQETLVPSLDQEDSLEKEIATHSSVFTWGILWTEEPGGLQSMGVAKSKTWLSNTTLSPHGCSFKSWERLKFHSELQTRCSVVLDFLKHLSISPQHLKIDESLPAYLMNQVPSCVKWEFWALHLGSISGLWAVVDIRWDNALCGQQVHDRGWHLACEPLKIWFCSFPHSPYLSASCQHSPVTKWLQGWYVARYWEHRQNPCGPSQELHAGGGRGVGGPGCPSAPLSPRAAPPRMPTSPDLPLLTHFFFSELPVLTFSSADVHLRDPAGPQQAPAHGRNRRCMLGCTLPPQRRCCCFWLFHLALQSVLLTFLWLVDPECSQHRNCFTVSLWGKGCNLLSIFWCWDLRSHVCKWCSPVTWMQKEMTCLWRFGGSSWRLSVWACLCLPPLLASQTHPASWFVQSSCYTSDAYSGSLSLSHDTDSLLRKLFPNLSLSLCEILPQIRLPSFLFQIPLLPLELSSFILYISSTLDKVFPQNLCHSCTLKGLLCSYWSPFVC